ncbi:uncharacterized protein LOC143237141 [Tachypleus tridentatus]|uniref:uncharacterized protein LOC143237141 n=1 Tax=Tachypleus tridentatus TaxID=6853 RepID=UPI003FD422DB
MSGQNTKCPSGFFGYKCSEKCPSCIHAWKGCDHITGHCLCLPGYTGSTCSQACPSGFWGLDCLHICNCKNGGECDPITGRCFCLPGWTGNDCSAPCPSGTFGVGCSQKCVCLNEGHCRSNDGVCRCAPGWMGIRCSEMCPDGFYGDHCLKRCNCSGQNFVCSPTNGCVCKYGYRGEKCDSRYTGKIVRTYEEGRTETSSLGLVIGVTLVVVLVVIVLLIFVYYRRKVKRLKSELAYVTYTADPGQMPDQHHFDNPVYACNSSGGTKNNKLVKQIKNDLTTKSNIEKAKLEDKDDLVMSEKGACGISFDNEPGKTKLKDLDYNPNIYHSIDDLKPETLKNSPFYEELKKNTSPDNDSEYDHLQYDRPRSKQKTHYHSVNGTTSKS